MSRVTNLSTNVALTYSVQAINQYNKPTAFSTSVTSATLAAVPVSFVVGNVYTSSMTVNWQSNGTGNYCIRSILFNGQLRGELFNGVMAIFESYGTYHVARYAFS